jgi:nitrite reductase/ring-hydroxylating ferredoxin subunit
MSSRYRLTSVDTVEEDGAWLFTVENVRGNKQEIFLTPCEDGDDPIKAWVNNCTHEDQALYREGVGAVTRDGGIVCPKHGSIFDSCSGDCGNGPARDSTLQGVDVTVDDGQVYLTDTDADFLWEGGTSDDDDDDMPNSTSHLSL